MDGFWVKGFVLENLSNSRSFCLKNLVVLAAELLIAFGAPSEPIDTLWMFHAFATLASATNVAQEDSAALQAITSIFDSLLESFTCDQWHHACSDSGGAHDGAACDVIEALWRVRGAFRVASGMAVSPGRMQWLEPAGYYETNLTPEF